MKRSRFNLERFVEAQDPVYANVLAELKAGEKRSHWMWYIFPQIAGLGHSHTADYYAIANLDEARAYLDHPILGPRLLECAGILLGIGDRSAERIFGFPDVLKLRSSMTLFKYVAAPGSVFGQVLDKFYEGREDPLTLEQIRE